MLRKSFGLPALALCGLLPFASCIDHEGLPNICVDITDIRPSVEGTGIVKSTIQENGVTLYADMQSVNLRDLDLSITTSEGSSSYYVDVRFDTTYQQIEYGGQTFTLMNVDTLVTRHDGGQRDFSQTRYLKVLAQGTGLRGDDYKTPATFSKFGGIDPETGRLYKIWSIQVLPANVPTLLTFDKWYNAGGAYKHPFEYVTGSDGTDQQINVWASTNSSLHILLSTLYKPVLPEHYGTAPTDDAVSGRALKLSTRDIHLYDQVKPYVAGCMYIGEFDGNDGDPLTCTHIGVPFDKKPRALRFSYKFHPGVIPESGVPESRQFAGHTDEGFIKAMLFRSDSEVPYLDGRSIQDNSFPNVVAYAEFYPDHEVSEYTKVEVPFVYTHNTEFNAEDMKSWKYSLALYFASSRRGFIFVGSGETVLCMDNVEIDCQE